MRGRDPASSFDKMCERLKVSRELSDSDGLRPHLAYGCAPCAEIKEAFGNSRGCRAYVRYS